MGNSESCPVYDGNFVRADSGAVNCGACPPPVSTSEDSWLIFHLLVSFVLVAYVRWSRVVIHNHACNERELPACCQRQLHERAAARLTALRTEYASFLQMLKVGLPRVVVDHKMRAESKDPSVLDELIATTTKAKKVPAPIEILKVQEPVEDKDPEHTQKVESFMRMIKVGVPRHLVEMKARREGVDPAELDGKPATVLAARSRRSSISSVVSTAPSTPDALATRSASTVASNNGRTLAMMALRKMNNGMRKKLHWSTTPYTEALVPAQRRDSLWSKIHAKDKLDRVCISTESRRWMEKLFVKVVAKAKRERANSNPAIFDEQGEPEVEMGGEEEMAKDPGSAFLHRKLYVVLLDHKKSQNIAIVLARVKRTFPELTHEILTLNCDVLSSPALQSLIDMWPDSAEQEAIDQFDGDVSRLATAEQFLIVARKIPRAQQKLRCLQFKMDFAPRVEELRDNLKLLIRGIQQVCASDRFAGVLEYVFHLGNLLNFGEGVEYTEWVKSISISSLAKLSFTKAYDGRISFLQYVIQSVERDEPHLALFSDQLPLITKCSKLSVQSLFAECQSLKGGLRMLINETQKAAVFKTDDADLRADLAKSRESMRLYAMEVEQELNGVQELVDQLERERKHFLNYFEEEDALPIDELLGFIASFADEYTRERQQLILRARRALKTNHNRSSSTNSFPLKRHSL
ncbi:formin-homology 2 domain-containing protein [Phytophthora infestans T30-4]|uniref:Formin-homology 2 domain-containing protein n=1 Tax=Phytophthora infestans (strain T30-4) TaxID=403677 RepID=D0N4W4_PHYIT|nr:formin-homology 2 domain-containing protein [Phytophthora infestans T30-4]EEY69922.1 formin-homology 2 domain-containing protein [Phytophthora infestans T30-4]|eukprot:XP_002998569.1 formin-homology 2 domain-containing protein [Phytophthora infestans T30-4]